MWRDARPGQRYVRQWRHTAAVLCSAALLAAAPCPAAQLFSLSQTGAQLAANPNVIFHEAGAVTGSALDFTSGAAGNGGFLFEVPILPAAARGALSVTVGIDFTALSGDNDFIFGLHDGAHIAGWERSDNNAGSWWVREGAVNGTQVPGFALVQSGLDPLEPFTLVYEFPDGPGDTLLTVTEGVHSTSFTFSANALDGDAALRFFMAREGAGEDYRINLLTIAVIDDVPVVVQVEPVLLGGSDFVSADTRLRASSPTTQPWLQRRSLDAQLAMIDAQRGARMFRREGLLRAARPVASAASGAASGLSAGAGDEQPWSLWADVSVARDSDDFSATAYGAHSRTLLLGADALWAQELLLGAVLGHEEQDLDTRFNAGEQAVDQYLAAVYGAYLLGDRMSLDGAAGFTRLHIEQFRTQPLAGRVRSELDGNRWFAAGNLNLHYTLGALLVDVSTGVLLARDRLDSFTESNGLLNPARTTRLGQWRIGAGLAYPLAGVELFASGYYVRDFKRERVTVGPGQPRPADDRDEVQLGAGLRYATDNVSASLEYQSVVGRENLDSDRLGLNLRIQF